MERLIMVFALFSLLLVGCSRADPGEPRSTLTPLGQPSVTPTLPVAASPTAGPTAIPTVDPAETVELLARVSAAEQAWHDSQIASYRMTVLEVHSIWSAQRLTITVADGQVSDIQTMCIPAPSQGSTCTIQPVEIANYLVPALFRQARDLAERQRPEHVRLTFDPALGYPTLIGFDDPQILDEDYGVKVESFERLPGRPASELGTTLYLRVGEAGQAEGLAIEVVRIVEDSRCPRNVACAWAGQIVVELSVTAPGAQPELVQITMIGTSMRPESAVQVAGAWRMWLTSVTPYPVYEPSGPSDIPAAAYEITLQVQR
jgi:Family of unknown function (DUF6174)